jgi:glycosyltransferase involved in cell wall biosynthesis
MRRETQWPTADRRTLVHVAGRVTDEVFCLLGPATNALARSGVEQSVIMIDEARWRHHIVNLHESAELVLVPSIRNPLEQWRAVLKACRAALADAPVCAVHLHGMLPCLVGAWAVRSSGVDAPIFYSPHGSKSLSGLRLLAAFALWLLRPARHRAIVNVAQESIALANWKSVELVESPVGNAFFEARRNEARHPLIVTGSRDQSVRSAELLAQLAVLLSGEELRIAFNWIGSVDPVSRVRLNAANVGVFDVTSDADCAARLAAGWIYLAPGGTRGFPLFLVEAMAAGLACVAFDCAQHRAVIRDGETGFLCKSEREMVGCIAALIDSSELRARLGQAAREEASSRFVESRFSAKLLAAYSLAG